MGSPRLERYRELAATGYEFIPIYSEQSNDAETPVTLFTKLTDGKERFLLESLERGKQTGRYSFIGWHPLLTLQASGQRLSIIEDGASVRVSGEPLAEMEKKLSSLKVSPMPELGLFYGGAVGYIGYDYVRQLEKLPSHAQSLTTLPDLYFVVPQYLVRFDHLALKITSIYLARVDPTDIDGSYAQGVQELAKINQRFDRNHRLPPIPNTVKVEPSTVRITTLDQSLFMGLVERIQDYIRTGEVKQVVLSQRIIQEYTEDPFFFYRVLRLINPSPYLFYLDFDTHQIAGSSPEMMVRLEDGLVTLKPIGGTKPRGHSVAEDKRLYGDLVTDAKERSEHMMLVELGQHDLDGLCQSGSLQITELMTVEFYSHVMHLVSTIQGNLLPAYSGFDLLRAVFPAGTLTGIPKRRAMEIIEALEPTRRNFYGGCVGYLGFNGNLDTCITIRSVLFHDHQAHLQVGAGIVAGSNPEQEYKETLHKGEAVLTALALALSGDHLPAFTKDTTESGV
jgi:anthranilate synthase component 1